MIGPRLAHVGLAAIIGFGAPSGAVAQVFGSPVALNSDAATDQGIDVTPRIVTDGAGTWVVAWQGSAGDVALSRSTDAGATWTPRTNVNPGAATRGGGVQLATDGTTWMAVWVSSAFGGDGDVLVARSMDGGITWTAPVPIDANAVSDTALDGGPRIATDAAGTWVVVWSSRDPLGGPHGSDSDILVARSTDAGATWTAPTVLDAGAAVDTANDEEPRLAADGAGTWVAIWRSDDPLGSPHGTDLDLLVSRSLDGGVTWTAPVLLDPGAATDVGDDYFPTIATDRAGTWLAAWTTKNHGGAIGTDEDILVARSIDGGVTWTPPAPLDANAALDVGNDTEVELASDGHGRWVAVWYGATLGATGPSDDDPRMARSLDGGVTWSFPLPLNDGAAHDRSFESDPHVATDGAGTWIAVWDSQDSLHGTIGTDFDILVARGAVLECAATPMSCDASPSAPRSTLFLKDRTPDRGDAVLWKWTATGAPLGVDLGTPTTGDPVSGTTYRFCVYDAASALVLGAAVPAGGRCGSQPCWHTAAGGGFAYHDGERTPDGVDRLRLQPSDPGTGKLVLKAKGERLSMPALATLAFPLRVQLQRGADGCWEATFAAPTIATSSNLKASSN